MGTRGPETSRGLHEGTQGLQYGVGELHWAVCTVVNGKELSPQQLYEEVSVFDTARSMRRQR